MKYVYMVNAKNNRTKKIKWGVSWVYLLFGGWALIFSGRWIYILIEVILNVLIAILGIGAPLTVVYHIWLFLFGNRTYARWLYHKGWHPDTEEDKALLHRI